MLGPLGEGGMGQVFAAFDPALDRKVALKTLHGDGRDARLVREAQAMARLQHPNVCTVFEIGSVGERMFVAMELVDGETLRDWMKKPHRLREVLAMFIAAGRGLEAVHGAGLVHRDFKPDNVLVAADLRPRVSDFGLVSDGTATLGYSGTPAYMAPEQRRGQPADARSDQFSFCVALWEALEGKRPFASDAPPDARHAPSGTKAIPAWLGTVLTRGLAVQPADRWPDMGQLLDALGHDPAKVRRRWLIGAGVLSLAVAGASAGKLSYDRQARACTHAGERLAGIWDAPTQQRLETAFNATHTPLALQTWQRVHASLDSYARQWSATHEDACRATHIDGRQSEQLLDLRMSCLERRRTTLQAMTELWSVPLDRSQVEAAPQAAASLEPIADCSDIPSLTEPVPLPRDQVARARITAVEVQLDRVRALLDTGRLKQAQAAIGPLVTEADAVGFARLRGETRFLLGTTLDWLADPAAVQVLEEGAPLSAEGHDDATAARALLQLVQSLSNLAAKPDRALAVVPAAAAMVARANNPPALEAMLWITHGQALLDAGKRPEAHALMTRVLPGVRAKFGPDANETLLIENVLAGSDTAIGDYDGARALFAHAVEAATKMAGPDTAGVAGLIKNLGQAEERAGMRNAARAHYEKALADYQAAVGTDNQYVAELYDCLGNLDRAAGKYDEAAAGYLRSIRILETSLGNEHAYTAMAYGHLGAARRGQGRLDEALELGKKSLAIARKTLGEKHVEVASIEEDYALTLRARGQLDLARRAAEETVEILVAGGAAPDLRGQARFELAEMEWAAAERERARKTAELALADLQLAGASGTEKLQKLKAWQQAHRRH